MDKKFVSDNKRVILLTGDRSKWYDQAIFIVKKGLPEELNAADLITEAERIIQNYKIDEHKGRPPSEKFYTRKKPPVAKKKQPTVVDKIVNLLIFMMGAVFLFLLLAVLVTG